MTKSNTISPQDKLFQQRLNVVDKSIKKLYYKGTLFTPERPVVAIVGSRRPTVYGQEVTRKLAYDLASCGVIVASGLALGADALAHEGALAAGGTTIAVLPGDVNTPYPRTNARLAERILATGGCLLSEYPPGIRPMKHHFIARNRIVAALSDAIVVTEAAERSGTLSTVNFALDQGKPVLAVPGNITNPLASGCNTLIKSGALPVTEVADILLAIGYQSKQGLPEQLSLLPEDPETVLLYTLIAKGQATPELLATQSALATPVLQKSLTLLEIAGHIRQGADGSWHLA